MCGDALGIEEASSAMMEGYLTGLNVANYLGKPHPNSEELIHNFIMNLIYLEMGPLVKKTHWHEKLKGGIPCLIKLEFHPKIQVLSRFPKENDLLKPKAILECYEDIPCNPCSTHVHLMRLI